MNIYGITFISSEGDLVVTQENGENEFCESLTKLFASKEERAEYAAEKAAMFFDEYGFETALDANGTSKEDLISAVTVGVNTNIQGDSDHIQIEFFTQDLGDNIINKDDYIATVLWSDEDVVNELESKGYTGTPEQVAIVENTGLLRGLGDCTDADWELISDAIRKCENELIRLEKHSPDKK